MRIDLSRIVEGAEATLGVIRVDGEPLCFSLEDQAQREKVPGETRIPAGRYQVRVRTHGGLHKRCLRRFPALHRGMLELAGVAGFSDILIHPGNTDRDTAGCILPGFGAELTGRFALRDSVKAYRALYERVIRAAELGDLETVIRDADHKESVT